MKEAENNNEEVDFMPNAKSSSIFFYPFFESFFIRYKISLTSVTHYCQLNFIKKKSLLRDKRNM